MCNIYASGGQDRRVCVKDIRVGGKNVDIADIEIENCHEGGVHSVQVGGCNGDIFELEEASMLLLKVVD